MPKINPYDPLYIPNPADLRKPEVSPKGEGLRKVAEANRQVLEEMHKGDENKAWQQGYAIGGGLEGLAKIGGKFLENHQQNVQQLKTKLADAGAADLVYSNRQSYSDAWNYFKSNNADNLPKAYANFQNLIQNGGTYGGSIDANGRIQNPKQITGLQQSINSLKDNKGKDTITSATYEPQLQNAASEALINADNDTSTWQTQQVGNNLNRAMQSGLQTIEGQE